MTYWLGVLTPFVVIAVLVGAWFVVMAARDWNRSRRSLVTDWTDERARAAACVMLTRRLWAIRIPGSWIWIGRPLYRDAADSDDGRSLTHYENALRDAHRARDTDH